MQRVDTLVIAETLPRERLDRYLADKFEGVSRSTLQRMIVECAIKVDGRPAKPTQSPRAGEVVTITWPNPEKADAQPQEIPLNILYEDADLLVLNKPADLVVHPSAGHRDGTIVNAVLHHCRGQLSGVGGVERPGIVHRLDLGTSGCLVIAKNDRTHLALTTQFYERNVEKIYQTLLAGQLPQSSGDIRAAIARHPTQRKKMAVVEPNKGRHAHTSFHRLETLRSTTFVEVQLHTGRTHQIRVHFAHLGFPVLGDELYGKRASSRVEEETGYRAPRQLLHARRLTLRHPRLRRMMEFNAPLPDDFKDALARLRSTPDAPASHSP